MYLLHTNVVSALRRPRPHGAVLEWLRSTDDVALHLSALTVVTRNVADFEAFDVPLLNPFSVPRRR